MLTVANKGGIMILSSSMETYLKNIYLLESMGKKVRVTDLAQMTNFTKPSISKALKKLAEMNLIDYEIYKDIMLTDEARKIAKNLIVNEDLIEIFLVGILNVDGDTAKKDIEAISHHISDDTKDALRKYISTLLKFDNNKCGCASLENCKSCEKTLVKNKIISNQKWLEVLEGSDK